MTLYTYDSFDTHKNILLAERFVLNRACFFGIYYVCMFIYTHCTKLFLRAYSINVYYLDGYLRKVCLHVRHQLNTTSPSNRNIFDHQSVSIELNLLSISVFRRLCTISIPCFEVFIVNIYQAKILTINCLISFYGANLPCVSVFWILHTLKLSCFGVLVIKVYWKKVLSIDVLVSSY